MDDMYREILLDYYRNPKNKLKMENSDISCHDSNPLCGDDVSVHIKLKGDRIEKMTFTGTGCVISQAAVSMLCEHMEGKTLRDALAVTKDDILKMLGTELTPVRLKCALLGMHVMQKGIHDYQKKKQSAETF